MGSVLISSCSSPTSLSQNQVKTIHAQVAAITIIWTAIEAQESLKPGSVPKDVYIEAKDLYLSYDKSAFKSITAVKQDDNLTYALTQIQMASVAQRLLKIKDTYCPVKD